MPSPEGHQVPLVHVASIPIVGAFVNMVELLDELPLMAIQQFPVEQPAVRDQEKMDQQAPDSAIGVVERVYAQEPLIGQNRRRNGIRLSAEGRKCHLKGGLDVGGHRSFEARLTQVRMVDTEQDAPASWVCARAKGTRVVHQAVEKASVERECELDPEVGTSGKLGMAIVYRQPHRFGLRKQHVVSGLNLTEYILDRRGTGHAEDAEQIGQVLTLGNRAQAPVR